MTSKSETGHAKNLANFNTLTTYIVGYGATYNPSKTALKLPNLQALATSATSMAQSVHTALSLYSTAVSSRDAAFVPFNATITRVLNALKASDTTTQIDQNAVSIVRKLRGARASAKKTEEEKAAALAEGKEIKEISTAQMGIDNRLDNFDKLLTLLSEIPDYMPNEVDLQLASLTALSAELKNKNNQVVAATAALSNARLERNNIMYKPLTGLVDVAFDVKTYVKSIFGATSPQYKQIAGLQFRKSSK